MRSKILFLITLMCCLLSACQSQKVFNDTLSLSGFTQWIIGRDSATLQLIPATGLNAIAIEDKRTVAHARFTVTKYGEMSFPINPAKVSSEAVPVDLSKSRFIIIKYRANHEVILQLRQTGVHGGVHNHVILPASEKFIIRTVYFSSFKGGLKPLDLKDVAKFNFAFTGNNPVDGFAEVIVRSFEIHHYRPL